MSLRNTLGKAILRLLGWRTVGLKRLPDKCVIVGAPHTSNWDLVYGFALAAATGVRIKWMGKKALFEGPLGPLMRLTGGIPVDRSGHHRAVDQVAAWIDEADHVQLVIAPEGTRSRTRHWKTGFYWIAHEAGVPIVLAFLDYSRKLAGIGPILDSSMPLEDVIEEARRFYTGMEGHRRGQFGPVALRPAQAAT